MLLKILSPVKLIFEGEVEKVLAPTIDGDIGILPKHASLSSIIIPWIVKILPKEKESKEFIKWTEFLFEDDKITLAVGKGLLYLDGDTVVMLVGTATTKPISDEKALEKMKEDLEKEIEQIKAKWDVESIEKAYLSLQQITADLKLYKMHKHKL